MTREEIEQKAVERFPVDSFGQTELISKQYAKQNAYIEGALMVVESQWVSVDERLPELYSDVLCSVNDEYPNGEFTVIPMIYSKELNQFLMITVNGVVDCTSDVIYWQPLPKPPKQTK